MQAAQRIAKNTIILYARMAITVFISLYSTRLVLGALGANDFGLFNVVGGLIAMLGFLSACMSEATQRFMSFVLGEGNSEKLKQIFNVSIVLHLLIAIILTLILEIAGHIFFENILNIPDDRREAAQYVYQFMIFSTFFTVVAVPYDSVINSRENMLLFAVLGILESIFKLLIAFTIVYSHSDKLIVYGLLTTLLSVFLLTIRVIFCSRVYSECAIRPRRYFDLILMKQMSSFAGWSLLGYSSSMIAFYGQGIVLNIFFGTMVNAALGIANQISGQLGTFAHILMKALNPTIAKSEGSGDRGLMIRTAMFGSKISFFLLMVIYVPIMIEMDFILRMWLKEVPAYTTIFCQLLLVRNLIEQLFLTFISAISAVGRIKKFQLIGFIISLFPLPVTYLVFSYGLPPQSLYFVYIVYSIVFAINIIYYSKRTFRLPVLNFLRNVLMRCILSFLLVIAVTDISTLYVEEGINQLILAGITSCIAFCIVVWKLGLSKEEKRDIMQLASSMARWVLDIYRKLSYRAESSSIK